MHTCTGKRDTASIALISQHNPRNGPKLHNLCIILLIKYLFYIDFTCQLVSSQAINNLIYSIQISMLWISNLCIVSQTLFIHVQKEDFGTKLRIVICWRDFYHRVVVKFSDFIRNNLFNLSENCLTRQYKLRLA